MDNIRIMYFYQFLRGMMLISGVLVPFYLDWGQVSYLQIMVLQSIFVFSVFVLEVPTGAIADRFGRKTSLMLSSIVALCAVALYSAVPNFYFFVFAEFLWAGGVVLMSGADEALVYDSLRNRNEAVKIFGRFRSVEILGIAVSGPIGSIIASAFGLRYAMMLTVIPMGLSFVFALMFKEPPIQKTQENYFATMLDGLRYLKNHRLLRIFAADTVIFGALVFFIIWMYQPVLTEQGVPIAYFGFVHALIAGAQVIFMQSFEPLQKVFGKGIGLIRWCAIITGLTYIVLAFSTNAWLSVILCSVIAAFGMSRPVLFQGYINEHIESKNRATVISAISMLRSLLMGILYPIVGLIVEYSLFLAIMLVGLGILAATFFSGIREEHFTQ